jgi:hypothetical protein
MKRFFLLTLCAAVASPAAQAAIFTVGGTVNCTHTSIQAALDAASANAQTDTIRVSNQLSYTAQALSTGGGDFTLEGGYGDCSATTPTGSTTISGQGGAADSVLKISGDGVRNLKRLLITRGDAIGVDGRGGGIRFDGTGDLILQDVSVDQNAALSGGGICFRSTGGASTLLINDNSSISRNLATESDGHGGGISVIGNARLIMSANNTSIFSNTASGINSRGGGVAVFGPARADIGSPGLGPFGAIHDNEADFGGGIAVYARNAPNVFEPARIRVYTTVATRPVRIHGNRARSLGGAGFARSDSNFAPDQAGLCLLDARIDDNAAPEGAALYMDTAFNAIGINPVGSILSINAGGFACEAPESAEALGAVRCTPNVAGCNVIENNRAINIANSAPTTGAIILVQTESESVLRRVSFLGNSGGSVIDLREARSLDLGLSLLAGNLTSSNLLKANSGTESFRVVNASISNNNIGDARVISRAGSGPVEIKNNLINQPGKLTLGYGGNVSSASADIAYNVSTDVSTLPPGSFNVSGPIRLTDPARGNFRQRIASRGVDVLPIVAGDDRDLDGRLFDFLNPVYAATVSAASSRDAGAFERQFSEPWLINGDFDGDLNQWSNSTPTLTTYSALNAPESSGGSVQFTYLNVPGNTTPRYNALVQCFNVPAVGTYRLSAFGRSPGNPLVTRDRPVIRWRLRSNSGNCGQGDPIDAEGDLFLPNGASFAESVPMDINVGAAQFSANTTIELRLDVEPDVLDLPIEVGFDRVILRQGGGASIFADGFE